MRTSRATVALCLTIAVVYGVELGQHAIANETALLRLGALPNSGKLDGQYWRMVAHAFLHFDALHLGLNLAGLWFVGRVVERRLGPARMLFVYACGALAGGAAILGWHAQHPTPGSSQGASGGMFGILTVAIVLAHRGVSPAAGASLTRALWAVLILGLVYSLAPGVSMAGHLGGMAGGLVSLTLSTVVRPRGQVDAHRPTRNWT